MPATNQRLQALLCDLSSEGLISNNSYLVFVDDGSSDSTWKIIQDLAIESQSERKPLYDVKGIRLSRNFGFQNALLAGLESVVDRCDIAITIDADLQDDISSIREMIELYIAGNDIIFGVRNDRNSDSKFKRESARLYYQMLHHLGVKTISNHADFRLLSNRVIKDLLLYDERNLFLRGLVAELGYQQAKVYYTRQRREAGVSKFPLRKMLNFAIDGITSFSVRPVRMIFFVGLAFLLTAIGIFLYVIIRHMHGHTIEGWTSLMLSIWFCSGTILMALGVIGEYIGKIYTEVKHRPLYSIREKI